MVWSFSPAWEAVELTPLVRRAPRWRGGRHFHLSGYLPTLTSQWSYLSVCIWIHFYNLGSDGYKHLSDMEKLGIVCCVAECQGLLSTRDFEQNCCNGAPDANLHRAVASWFERVGLSQLKLVAVIDFAHDPQANSLGLYCLPCRQPLNQTRFYHASCCHRQ